VPRDRQARRRSLAGDVEVEQASEYLYDHKIPAYPYNTETMVAALGANIAGHALPGSCEAGLFSRKKSLSTERYGQLMPTAMRTPGWQLVAGIICMAMIANLQ